MMRADTPMPGEDPGALIEDPPREDDLDPATEDVESDPQPNPAPESDASAKAEARIGRPSA